KTANDLTFHSVANPDLAQWLLGSGRVNVVLLDLSPTQHPEPGSALASIGDIGKSAPVIVIIDTADTELEQIYMDAGAVDVLYRRELTPGSLRRSLRYAITRREADQRLASLQLLDPVTGLASPPLFWEILNLAVRRAQRNQDFFAVLLVDVKPGSVDLTDQAPEGAGADLLRALTRRLHQIMRSSDTVGRLDRRQFAILAESMPRIEDVQIVAEKIISELAKPVTGIGQSEPLSVAVGIALYPTSAASAEDLISRAGEALQLAISRGHADFAFG
ncbi:MAG: GGDEF domain-containing protein, partial [Dongiaceae bacterium]